MSIGGVSMILPGLKFVPGSAAWNSPFMRATPSGETSCSIYGWCSTPTPWWWAPYFAVWSGALVLSVGYLPGWGSALGNLALVAASGFLIGYHRRHRGTWPTGDIPRELHRPLWMLLVGAVVVMAAAAMVNSSAR